MEGGNGEGRCRGFIEVAEGKERVSFHLPRLHASCIIAWGHVMHEIVKVSYPIPCTTSLNLVRWNLNILLCQKVRATVKAVSVPRVLHNISVQ